jgi:hypothetical protein
MNGHHPSPGADVNLPDLASLKFILHPMPVEVFLNEYWEKKVLHISRNDPGYYKKKQLFTLRDLDSFFGRSITNDEVSLVKAGRSVALSVEGEAKTTLYQYYEAYKTGYTSVIRGLHLCWEPVGEIASALALAFGCFISTHLYATPENSQGFTSHWDDHDIFALQLEGEKEWRLYDTGPTLPRYSQGPDDYQRQSPPLGEPSLIVNLKDGDLLYFPKGVIHEPRTRTCSSLHLTYGLYPETWEQLTVEALYELAGTEPQLRESLPYGFSVNPAGTETLQARAVELAKDVTRKARFEQARARLAARVLGKMAPLADGHFARLGSAAGVEPGTLLEKRKGMAGVAVTHGGDAKLHYPGGIYAASSELSLALQFIAEQDRFHARDIPGPAPEHEHLGMVRELIQAGFLKVAEPQSAR